MADNSIKKHYYKSFQQRILNDDEYENLMAGAPVLLKSEIALYEAEDGKCHIYIGIGTDNEPSYMELNKPEGIDEMLERLQYYGDVNITPTDASYFTFKLNDENMTAYIKKYDRTNDLTKIVIPYKYVDEVTGEEYIVTSIGEDAFFECNNITSVIIPDSVTTIGVSAFQRCANITNITIGKGVIIIDRYAFSYCPSLINITIPNSVTTISSGAFSNCKGLTSITIPNSVTSIGTYAFDYCKSLATITLSNNITSISDQAFKNCQSLTSITIPNSVTSIGVWAFMDCWSLTNVTIPNSVTIMGKEAFRACKNLISITIPDSISSLDDWAFLNCHSNLTISCSEGSYAETYAKKNNIPIEYINHIHDNKEVLDGITQDDINKWNDSYDKDFNRKDIYKGFKIVGISEEPKNDDGSFPYEIALNTVDGLEIGDKILISINSPIRYTTTIKEIYKNPITLLIACDLSDNGLTLTGKEDDFENGNVNDFLVALDKPGIGDMTVSFNTLTSGTNTKAIGDGGVAIGENTLVYGGNGLAGGVNSEASSVAMAFGLDTKALNSGDVSFGNANISKGGCSFTAGTGNEAHGYNAVSMGFYNKSIKDNSFTFGENLIANRKNQIVVGTYNVPSTTDIFQVANGTSDLRKNVISVSDNGNIGIAGNVTIDHSLSVYSKIELQNSGELSPTYCYGNFTYSHKGNITYPVKDNSLALNYNSTVDSNNIDRSTAINGYVITDMINSTDDCILPSYIDNKKHFNNKNKIVGLNLNSQYRNKGFAFPKIILPSQLEYIGTQVFGYSYINEIKLPNSLISIGHGAFQYSKSLREIDIPDSVTFIHTIAFYKCSNLNRVKLSNNLTSISGKTFDGCDLREVEIPNSVLRIKERAFANNPNLSKVVLPKSIVGIHSTAFDDCPNAVFYVESNSYSEQWCRDNYKNYTSSNLPVRTTVGADGEDTEPTIEITDNLVLSYVDVPLTAIILLPPKEDLIYAWSLTFTSGKNPTSVTFVDKATEIRFAGVDCADDSFVPTANKTYNIIITQVGNELWADVGARDYIPETEEVVE